MNPDRDIKSRMEELRFLEEYLCVESFFKKSNVTYGGDKLYWMLKEKITPHGNIELFRNKNFINS